jgi:glycosyltransferase involved in cell wall biosynthesis
VKILIVAHSFAPQINGVANVVYQHAKHFTDAGNQVTVATQYDENRDFDVIDGIRIKEFAIKGGPLISNFYRGELSSYLRFLRNSQAEFDVIFFHGWQIWCTDLVIFLKRHKCLGSKLILVSHCAPSTLWNSILRIGRSILLAPYIYLVMPLLMKKFDHMVFLSDKKNGDRHRDHKYAARKFEEKICTIPNGVPDVPSNLTPSSNIIEVFKPIQSKHILLFVANYGEGKNQKLALDVFEKLSVQNKSHLVLIGSSQNSYSEELISVINEKKLGNSVSVLFGLERNDVMWMYSKSFLTLFTSKTECSPLSVLESLAFGKPVIATDVGCLSEWVGVKVCSSPDEIAAEVDALLNDHEHYVAQTRAISSSAELTSWNSVMSKYDQLLSR